MTAPISYAQAMKDVRLRVKASGTSFASGMSVLPIPRREAMYAFYAFCREVDDIADDSPTAEVRNEGLKLWREKIRSLFNDRKAEDSICIALLPAIDKFSLIEEDFQAIIDGMDMDAQKIIVAPSMDYLDLYCDRVASAVGRVSVRIFGDPGENAMRTAFHLGRAFQLTNILRDLAEDAQRGRLYLPQELLDKHGIKVENSPQSLLSHPHLPLVCQDLAALALSHFEQADQAMKASLWHAMRPARLMRRYYGAILELLIKSNWQNPYKRVSLPLWQKIGLALRGLFN